MNFGDLEGTGVVIVNDHYTYSSLWLLPQSFSSLEAVFCHVDVSTTFLLCEINKGLYDDASKGASKWFKARIRTSTELTIAEMRKTRFQEDWIHDLLYDRLKLLRTELNPNADENKYTTF
ncbi:hypothetical protein K457DRAFT_23105 [Linnemannia elongata AG-77]|uniref:Uncharacterized protein n=1 Tax=Linnemannia elongata AG-77 TaxID=1314771 RepID=A0A197JM95_9FUNG|nr:hypothetical protein K457DRAFT_23105 [Linnemannia elongata AG-77]